MPAAALGIFEIVIGRSTKLNSGVGTSTNTYRYGNNSKLTRKNGRSNNFDYFAGDAVSFLLASWRRF